ncbi:SulP family inorganic anion transporter [Cryobacterium sp. GrIS_2_6]|uniref:SulP family inorganic anion transporter n=1 Tax=Cryobacterium sp. GrIS_2_6 TaxID=3162785 RepID=UPI002E0C8392|nr:SulP family inorganic anion transporter [Cryobacterium psychrotolerans]MEC5148776.1 high affinity sulfate transporter 1 [Cryobacterium psychrotolerans]
MADTGLRKWAPGVATVLSYRRTWLLPDLRAGAILTALLIPVGIGYAEVAGLPPVTGLFATIVPLLVYAVVGPSRILVLAPDSALAPIIAAAILPLAAGDSARAVTLAGLLGIMVGAALIVGGFLRLGFVTDLLSKPLRVGYLNALAVIVILSQIPSLLGFALSSASPLGDAIAIVTGIVGGRVNPTAVLFGIGSLGVIVVLVWTKSRIPGILVAVAASMVLTYALGLHADIPVVGALPAGLPAPALTGLHWADVVGLALPALGMALIAFADTAVLSRTIAARRGDTVDGNQEMAAVGASNLFAGLFGGFPISASSSRTAAAESAGARSQLAGVAGAVFLVLFMLLGPGLTDFLPSATIAAVVMVAAAGLVDIRGFVALVRMSKTDAVLSVAAFLGVLVAGVIAGIIVAVVLSLGEFIGHAWRPYRAELGRIHGLRGYHDLSRHPEGERLPGIVIVRFDAPLFFANGGIFDDYVRATVSAAGTDVRTVILAAEPITDIDTTAIDELLELDEFLKKRGATLVFAEMKGPVKDVLRRYGLGKRFPPERFADTVGAAVDAATGTLRGDLDDTQWDRDA